MEEKEGSKQLTPTNLGIAGLIGAAAIGLVAWIFLGKSEEQKPAKQNDNGKEEITITDSNVNSRKNHSETFKSSIPDQKVIAEPPKPEIQIDDPVPPTIAEVKPVDHLAKYQVLLANLKKSADTEMASQYFSMKFIIDLNDALVECCAPDFTDIMRKSRAKRRSVRALDTLAQYTQEVLDSTMDIESMLMNNMNKVCEDVGITTEKYETSNQYWAQINPQFALIQMLMLDKMKLLMPNTVQCDVTQALEVFDFQLQEFPNLTELRADNPQLTPMIKQSWLADLVHEKFGLEEEDYIKAPGLEHNIQFRQKAEQLAQMIQQEAMMMGGMGMPGMM